MVFKLDKDLERRVKGGDTQSLLEALSIIDKKLIQSLKTANDPHQFRYFQGTSAAIDWLSELIKPT